MKKLYTLISLVISTITFAQAPQGFNYQATVRNSTGALIVNQNVNFKFNLMLNSASSLPVFSETHMTPTDDLGQVNLVIGTGTATTGTFSTINWGNGNYYLGIELNTGSGYVAMGTTQLLSVPYALYANSSGNAQTPTPNLASVLSVNNGANNLQIKNLANPTEVQDAATKGYIDSQITALQAQLTALQNLTVSSSVSQQTICTETSTQVGLTSNQTNATFTWSVSILTLPSNGTITGFSSGNGNLIVQTLSNTGSSAGVVRYIITPYLGSISGQPINVDVNVNPKPIISNKIITIDSGSSFIVTPQNIQGDIVPAGGTSYDWTVSNTTGVNGASNQFSYQSISQILTNITNIPQTVIYTVTPSTNNCIGTPFTITVTVNPPATPLQNVTIGTQIWSSTNLNVTTYRDGTPIPEVTDPTAWSNLTTGAWCYYNNDPANGAIYGKLYNWYAVAGIHDAASLNDPSLRKKLAPWGWHIPTKEELNTLTMFLGGPSVAGGKMKEIGTAHWNSPNTGANNESNFTGLPGGYYDANSANSSFLDKNTSGYWWSSSVAPPVQIIGYAWSIILTSNSNGVTISEFNRAPDGLSVRLVKD